jgi:AcrR family transcriptional regulator
MSKKTAKKTPENPRDAVVLAALALAAEKGWVGVTMGEIGRRAGLSAADMHDLFEDRFDILAAYGRILDRKVLAAVGAPDDSVSERDRLFEIMMERFDALNEHRDGVIAILDSLLPDPKQAIVSLPHLCRSMAWMLDAAGIPTSGVKGVVKIMGLTALYLKTVRVWREDKSTDMSKTMAELDKNLASAEGWATRFC